MTTSALNSLGPMPPFGRMRTVDEELVNAPLEVIFDIVANVESWPRHLSHYRYVRFRERLDGGGIVEMSANRPFGVANWPTWWLSLMEVRPPTSDAASPVIRFRHIEGITRRMEVEWSFRRVAGGTHVSILHLWNGPAWPLVGAAAARLIIGPVFIRGIASRTLAGLARVATQRQT